MFTDIVGYTALGQRDEPRSLALLEENRKLLRPIFIKHHGTEIKTIGDAFLIEFASALDAVRCAYEIQRASREHNISLPNEDRLHLRVGVHLGDVVQAQGDILGDTVNIASRIEQLAEDGGVCLTQQVYDHVQNKFELPLVSLGKKTLKNVAAPLEVYRIGMPWEIEGTKGLIDMDRTRIAVLPLRNMSPDPNDEYFADGMTEELLTTLSGIKDLRVIARTSVMQYKAVSKRVSEIGRELNVGSLIEGSVRKAGKRLRITVQLIDARDEEHIWGQNYDRELDDVFAIQGEVAQKIAEALKVRLIEPEKRRLEKDPTSNFEAYTLYLKGRLYWNERSKEGMERAVQYFGRAIQLDPAYALGYAGLADSHFIIAQWNFENPLTNFQKAKVLAAKALELDENLAEAHATLGTICLYYDYNQVKAEQELKKAIELNPSYATAHHWYYQLLLCQERLDEAKDQLDRALDLDPFSYVINGNLGTYLAFRRQFDQAEKQLRKVLEMEPGFALAHWGLMDMYLRVPNYDEAMQEAMTIAKLSKSGIDAKIALAYVQAVAGKGEQARQILAELEARPSNQQYVSPIALAEIRFLLGDIERGFVWLEKAYEERDGHLPYLKITRFFDSVRLDPRYLSMLRRIGFQENLQTGFEKATPALS